jgi:hypothetical protein
MRRRIDRRHCIGILALAMLGSVTAAAEDRAVEHLAPGATPIIAEVFGSPEKFVGRSVAIYGLVIESRGERFLLQDVSEMPLVVVSPRDERITAGSQLMVYGKVRRAHGQLELASERVEPVRVLAGGGCC